MVTAEMIKTLNKFYASTEMQEKIQHNSVVLDILEGRLKKYVEESLKAQLNEKAFESARHRIAAINLLKKLIDKLSQVFSQAPVRIVYDFRGDAAGENEQTLWQWYETEMSVNEAGNTANEYFNAHKSFAFEPYLDGVNPRLRVLPADRFFVYSTDAVNPLRVTHFVKVIGNYSDAGQDVTEFHLFTDEEVVIYSSKDQIMSREPNPYGKIPFIYCARSKVDLIPQIDTDTLSMSILIPVLLTDINYAVMYQSFSIVYTIDASQTSARAPNAVLELKSDPESDKTPQIGSIKPDVDTDKVIALIASELTMWMESRNIKPGSLTGLNVQNAASGIAKAIDEMDTSVDRKKQLPFLKRADEQLAELILNHLHPVWQTVPGFEKPVSIPRGLKVKSTFGEQRPLMDTTQAINDQKTLIEMGIQSKRGALAALHPDWSDEEIDQRFEEIAEERSASQVTAPVKPAQDVQPIEKPGKEELDLFASSKDAAELG